MMNSFDKEVWFENENGRNDRFKYARVRQGEEWFFLKKASSPELSLGLQREIAWGDFMQHVQTLFPDEALRSPKVEGLVGDDAILFEYVDAPLLASNLDLVSWQKHIYRYAHMLYVLDQAAEGWSTHELPDHLERATNYFESWERWLGDNISRVKRLDETRAFIAARQSDITTRMQHGDLTPWQIFNDNDTWVIHDGERSGMDLARYHDLAHGYGRLFVTLQSRQTAVLLLVEFMKHLQISRDAFAKQFMPVMAGRAIGMLSDTYTDNRGEIATKDAEDLIDLCLEGDVEHLLSL